MDHENIRTLKLLEEIEKGHVPSQRELAKKLNISLGLVNSFIKRLAAKGYLKLTTVPKNRIKYILTTAGAAEKTRLSYKYIQYSFRFYKEARKILKKIFSDFKAEGNRRVIFYGAGDFAEIAYLSLKESGIHLLTVADELKAGGFFFDIKIVDPVNIDSFVFDKILITAIESRDAALEKILISGISNSKVTMPDYI
ncbi:MAG: winged helix-turn-helix transcriptional regulator [Desulfosarcina sp.]|nr:winged helix-turn-helix transcriptional regulator [Desulfobacterales bacterium]